MRTLQIATVGERYEDLLASLPEFSFSRLVLLHAGEHADEASRVADKLAGLPAEVRLTQLPSVSFADVLGTVTKILVNGEEADGRALVNVTSGAAPLCCAAVFAGIANGAEVVAAHGREIHRFPPATIPFWRFLSGPKEDILRALVAAGGRSPSIKDLARETRTNLAALNYHLRDPRNARGLADLGLVRLDRARGAVSVEVTPLGAIGLLRKDLETRRTQRVPTRAAADDPDL